MARLLGSSLLLVAGMAASYLLGFLVRVVAARWLGVSGYGVLNTILAFLSFVSVVAMLGLRDSLAREVAYLRAKGWEEDEVILGALYVSALSSLLLAFAIAACSPGLSSLLGIGGYAWLLAVASLSLPLMVLLGVVVAVARAYGRVLEKALVRDVGVNVLWLVGSLVLLWRGAGLSGVVASYIFSYAAGLFAAAAMLARAGLLPRPRPVELAVVKRLLALSLPLLVAGLTNTVMTYTDTVMLGALRGPAAAGIYNAGAPVARALTLFLAAAGYLALPLFSRLYARGEVGSLRRAYAVSAKWVYVATYPAAVLLVATPSTVLGLLFGKAYLGASLALAVLSAGFMVHVVMGLNGVALVALGESRVIMGVTVLAAFVNVVLNVVLISIMGVVGAAAATAVSYVVANVLTSLWLYRKAGIHPFSRGYVAVLAASIALAPAIRLAAGHGAAAAVAAAATAAAAVAAVGLASADSYEKSLIRSALGKHVFTEL